MSFFTNILNLSLPVVNGSDTSIAEAARVSYKKGTKQVSTDAQLIHYLVRMKHTSPLEQTLLQFYVKLPIFVARQWMRHRTWAFNEISGRFSELEEQTYIPLPEHITTQDPKKKQMRTDEKVTNANAVASMMEIHSERSFQLYHDFLEDGVARELARLPLPVSTYTEIVASVDLHNLLHFLDLRMDQHAQWEIRVYAQAIYDMMVGIFPATMEAWTDCTLNAFTLTGQMQEVLAVAIEESKYYSDWKDAAKVAADMFTWVSQSEKVQFIEWCVNKVQVKP